MRDEQKLAECKKYFESYGGTLKTKAFANWLIAKIEALQWEIVEMEERLG